MRLRLEGFLGTSDDEFQWAMDMNFFAALRATRAAIVPMLEQGAGAIVNVASVNAFFQPDAGTIDYGAAKAALVNLSKTLAQEFGPRGIRVNAISPGPVGTDLWLGEHGVAETVARPPASTPTRPARRWSPASAASRPAASRRPRRSPRSSSARLGAARQRHRLELRDRRRADQDDLSVGLLKDCPYR